jgi:hypothetical protein
VVNPRLNKVNGEEVESEGIFHAPIFAEGPVPFQYFRDARREIREDLLVVGGPL